MVNLPAAGNPIAVGPKECLHTRARNLRFAFRLGVEIGARLERIHAVVETRAGGTALGRIAIRLREQHATGCQGINVGRLGIRMPSQTAKPIIQIIHNYEHNIGPVIGGFQTVVEDFRVRNGYWHRLATTLDDELRTIIGVHTGLSTMMN